MATAYEVTLEKIIQAFDLKVLALPKPPDEIFIRSSDVNRPGLQLAGFFEVFDERRTQVLGESEIVFYEPLYRGGGQDPVPGILQGQSSGCNPGKGAGSTQSMVDAAKQTGIPLLTTTENTSTFISSLILFLNTELAPRLTRHGVLMEVYGEGMLIMGDSGVGKSETAVELIKRGHRLVADDAVELRKITAQRISGTSPDNIRHFLELRGIGIINARRIFGMGAIKSSVDVDLIVNLELWDDNKVYDRMGMEDHYTDILGVQVPSITIPVKPGRNIAVILEVAAMNYREKKLGYNAATNCCSGWV